MESFHFGAIGELHLAEEHVVGADPDLVGAVEGLVDDDVFQGFGVFAEVDEFVFAAFEVLEVAGGGAAALLEHPAPDGFLGGGVLPSCGQDIFHYLLDEGFGEGGVLEAGVVLGMVDGLLDGLDESVDGCDRCLLMVVLGRGHAFGGIIPSFGRDAEAHGSLVAVTIE